MLAFGPTGVVNASVQADTTTPATTQAGGIVAESAQPQNSGDETALDTAETKINIVANTTDTSRTSEQKTTTAQATENSSSASSVNKTVDYRMKLATQLVVKKNAIRRDIRYHIK